MRNQPHGAIGNWSRWRRPRGASEVALGREEFFERRKERQQVESVLDAEKARLREEQERRTQRELDDWFGMKQARQHSRAREMNRNPNKPYWSPPKAADSGRKPA